MKMKKLALTSAAALPLLMCMSGGAVALDTSEEDFELKLLGKYLFFDKISDPTRQACATCHAPDAGWTNGTSGINLKQVAVTGANPHTVGNLKPPSNAYASFLPDLNTSCGLGSTLPGLVVPSGVCGGNFWNGRAKGNSAGVTGATGIAANAVESLKELRDDLGLEFLVGVEQLAWGVKYLGPTADQAHASPFVNPVEQGLPDRLAACEHVQKQKYAALYERVWDGPVTCDNDVAVNISFARFAVALAAYQHSNEVNAFDSKRDRALANDADGKFPLDDFTDEENEGHDLFYNAGLAPGTEPDPDLPRTNCSFCHNSSGFPLPHLGPPFGNGTPVDELGTNPEELYADMAYHNIGTPRNHEIPGNPAPDDPGVIGLEAISGVPGHRGAQKTPTLRNVDKRRGAGFKKAYSHNGWFKSLESLVHFYNTAVVDGATAAEFGITRCPDGVVTEKDALAQNCWPEPENVGLLAFGLIGDMGMDAVQEAALVAYLKTLTDIPTAKAPAPFDMKKLEKGQLN
jgi:cytochrome c peroxidase